MKKIERNTIYTTKPDTKRLHRVKFDTDIYFVRATLLAGEGRGDFEEVDIKDVPQSEESESE